MKSYENVIKVIEVICKAGMISKDEAEGAIKLLNINVDERVNRLARKISHIKDVVEKRYFYEEKLRWCVKVLQDESVEIRSITQIDLELDKEEEDARLDR